MEIESATKPVSFRDTSAGFWSGFWLFIFGFILIVAAQVVAVILLGAWEVLQSGTPSTPQRAQELFADGDAVSIAFIFLFPVIVALLALIIKFRHKARFFEYLAFSRVGFRELSVWLLAMAVLLALSLVFNKIFDRPVMPEWVATAYNTANYYGLFVLTVCILGPVTEELLFRGYILKAWTQSRLGPVGGSLLLSLLWALIHLQYDLYDMTWVFLIGILLCWSRLKSGSIYSPLLVHICWNTLSMIHVWCYSL